MVNSQTYRHSKAFKTESGKLLQELEIAFTTSGKLTTKVQM
jgi:homoserine acetyltransferase